MSKENNTRPSTAHIPPFGLRMQPELRQALERSAKWNGRSLNAEIVYRLEKSIFSEDQDPTPPESAVEIDDEVSRAIESASAEFHAKVLDVLRSHGHKIITVDKDGNLIKD